MQIVSRTRTVANAFSAVHRYALLRRRIAGLDDRGQGLLEYAIIAGIVIIGAVATLVALSGALNHMFSQISDTLSQY